MRYLINMPYPIVASLISDPTHDKNELIAIEEYLDTEDKVILSESDTLKGAFSQIILLDNELLSRRSQLPSGIWNRMFERLGLDGAAFFQRYDHIIHLSHRSPPSDSYLSIFDNRDLEVSAILMTCDNVIFVPNTGIFSDRVNAVIYALNKIVFGSQSILLD